MDRCGKFAACCRQAELDPALVVGIACPLDQPGAFKPGHQEGRCPRRQPKLTSQHAGGDRRVLRLSPNDAAQRLDVRHMQSVMLGKHFRDPATLARHERHEPHNVRPGLVLVCVHHYILVTVINMVKGEAMSIVQPVSSCAVMAKRVLVTGGSVAANTLAWWMAEGGFGVTVVEKAPEFREGGQSIDVRGAGRKVLERMGVQQKVADSGTGETGWTFVNEKGEQVAAFELADIGANGPTAELEILRGDLAGILYEKVGPRVDYRFGDAIAAVEQDADAAHVRFESGREEDYALVLVAEGVGSSTREQVFPDENEPRWMDMTLGFFTIPKGETDGSDSRWYNAPGGRSVFLRPDRYGTTRAVLTLKAEAHKTPDLSEAEQKAWLHETFADAGWETSRVLDGLDVADDLYFEVLRQVRMDRWSKGRIALTGDAAWCATPVSGVGTTLAVVGAYILAGELAKTDDHAAAFEAYDRIMRPFVEAGQGEGKGPSWTHPQTRFGIMAQRATLNILSKPILRDAFMALGMRDPDDIDLPDYRFNSSSAMPEAGTVSS